MPEGLPPHLSDEDILNKVEPQVIKHNWIYSLVPVGERTERWDSERAYVDYPLVAALAGYCKQCNQAFSVYLRTDYQGSLKLQDVGIPKDGCPWTS